MVVLGKFEVYIESGGNRLREYEDEDLNTATLNAIDHTTLTAARYIQVCPGQSFCLHYKLKSGFGFRTGVNSLSWNFHLDEKFSGRVMEASRYTKTRHLYEQFKDISIKHGNQWKNHPLIFQELDITQDNISGSRSAIESRYQSIGSIEITVMEYFTYGAKPAMISHDNEPEVVQSIPEKALKGRAMTLGLKLGDGVTCCKPLAHTGRYVSEQPLAKIVYHYRTKRSLQDLMVIPKDAIEEMTAEQLRPLLKQQMARNLALKEDFAGQRDVKSVIKRERTMSNDADDDDDILEVREVKKSKSCLEVIAIDSD